MMRKHFFKEESPTRASFKLPSAGFEAEVISDPADGTQTFCLWWDGHVCLSKIWKDRTREEALASAWALIGDLCASIGTVSEVISLLEAHCQEASNG